MKPLTFAYNSWAEYQDFAKNDKRGEKKINDLIQDIDRNGDDKGIGHPEPLKHEWSGWWSREIDKKNRLIYKTNNGNIELAQIGSHYSDK
jgi:toxin YoeB